LEWFVVINRILIIGLGSIGQRHLRLARGIFPEADIRVLRHKSTEETPEYSNGVFSKIEESIAFLPQLAVIANPAPFHIGTAQALAEVGVNLLIEKPLSDTLEGVQRLIETCNKQGVVLLIGYNLRFLPSLKHFRDLLMNGVVGEILSVRCEIGQYLPSWRPSDNYRQGVSANRHLGGGALLELSHELDYLRWIFGEVDWVKATISKQSFLDIDVEDSAHLTLGFLPAKDAHQLIGTVNLDFIRHDTTRLCFAIGENGTLRWNGLTGEVDIYEAESKEWRELFKSPHQRDDSYIAEWDNFINSANGNQKPLITGNDGMKVLEIIETSRKSAAAGGAIKNFIKVQESKFNP